MSGGGDYHLGNCSTANATRSTSKWVDTRLPSKNIQTSRTGTTWPAAENWPQRAIHSPHRRDPKAYPLPGSLVLAHALKDQAMPQAMPQAMHQPMPQAAPPAMPQAEPPAMLWAVPQVALDVAHHLEVATPRAQDSQLDQQPPSRRNLRRQFAFENQGVGKYINKHSSYLK